MSTTPRIDSAVPGAPAEFVTVMSHTPDIIAKFGDLYACLLYTSDAADE